MAMWTDARFHLTLCSIHGSIPICNSTRSTALIHRGRHVLNEPIEKRRELLTQALAKVYYPVILSQTFNAQLPISPLRRIGRSRVSSPSGRVRSTNRPSAAAHGLNTRSIGRRVCICRYTLDNPFDALVVGVYDVAKLNFVSKARNGFVPHSRCEVFQQFKELDTDKCPFANLQEKENDVGADSGRNEKLPWLKPKLVAQIGFTEQTPDGHLRQSSYAGLREDKAARQAVQEES